MHSVFMNCLLSGCKGNKTSKPEILPPLDLLSVSPEVQRAEKLFYGGNPQAALEIFMQMESPVESGESSTTDLIVKPQLLEGKVPEKKVRVCKTQKPIQVSKPAQIVKAPAWILWCVPIVSISKVPTELHDLGKIKKIEEYWVYGLCGFEFGYGDILAGHIGLVMSGELKLRKKLEKFGFGLIEPIGDYAHLQSLKE